MKHKTKRIRIVIIIIVSLVLSLLGGFYIYTLDYYRADQEAIDVIELSDNVEIDNKLTIFYPNIDNQTNVGLIFYPGGKVEAIAYAPLLESLSQNGITCVLIEMPFNLAVFNINAADKIYDEFPNITKWYIGGHSLGGAMASSYVGKNSSKLDGLILLGAYPINDSALPTLVIYGSEDVNLDLTKITSVKDKIEITGGNHAYFGNYGEQTGDGEASISRTEQQAITTQAITEFIFQ